MKLWRYLKKRMERYKNRIAFANAGLTYADVLAFHEKFSSENKLVLCEGETREEQALSVLKCIASGDTAVPITKEYGLRNYEYIKNKMERASAKAAADLAFLMFTSGTTGVPKGVMLTDENIISNLEYVSSYFRLEGMKSICISRPLVHIAVLTGELLYALCNGLTVYFYEEAFMPQRLLSYFSTRQIDVFCATPTLFQALAVANKNKASCLKVAVLSGEILTKKTSESIAASFSQTKFYNVYGLTEHSPRVSALLPSDFERKAGSVGKPIGNVKTKIENGELLIKSPSVMRGYYLDEEKTKEKLRDGWLYTGDRARYDAEGFLYIEGRKDGMLIRSGINIYPEEIENAAKSVDGVLDCLAYGELNDKGTTLCMKYVGTAEVKELKKRLLELLNPHLIPTKIEKVEELARTASGKKLRT